MSVAGAALERHAVDRAGERDRHLVAVVRRGALGLRQIRPVLLGDAHDRLVDLGLGHVGGELLQRDVVERRKLDLRQDLHRDRIVEVGLALDHRLDRGLLGRQLDLRLHGEAQIVVGHDLGVGVAHRRLDRLGHHRAAVHPLQVPDRHLAGAEAVDAHRALELVEARVDLRSRGRWPGPPRGIRASILRRGFRSLAWSNRARLLAGPVLLKFVPRPKWTVWCGRRDLNPQALRRRNLKPLRLPVPPRPPRAANSRPRAARLISRCCGCATTEMGTMEQGLTRRTLGDRRGRARWSRPRARRTASACSAPPTRFRDQPCA